MENKHRIGRIFPSRQTPQLKPEVTTQHEEIKPKIFSSPENIHPHVPGENKGILGAIKKRKWI